MDSRSLGHIQFLCCGPGCTFAEPPKRMPDSHLGIGWRYLLVGTVNLETGEIGHAVFAWYKGIKIKKATIIPDADSVRHVHHAKVIRGRSPELDNSLRQRQRMETQIMLSLARPLAQRIWKATAFRKYRHFHIQRRRRTHRKDSLRRRRPVLCRKSASPYTVPSVTNSTRSRPKSLVRTRALWMTDLRLAAFNLSVCYSCRESSVF
jgi:hypothetical protein